jgi:hypothetical protein
MGLSLSFLKKKGANKIQLFIPICLLNVCFNIFSKVLALRFDPAVGKVVSECFYSR